MANEQTGPVDIRPARASELDTVLALLDRAGLPADGVAAHFERFLVAWEDGRLVGAIGLERYEDVGLLRSLAVSPDRRSAGLGGRLVERLLDQARHLGLREIYLLTTTAEGYFPRFGFAPVDRAAVDPRLKASRELSGACPETAVSMRLTLRDA